MFEVILRPITNAIQSYMDNAAYQAAKSGALNGLRRFQTDVSDAVEALAHAEARPVALPVMASANQTTEATASDDIVEKARQLIASGVSQREAARQLGVPESTLRTKLKQD